MKDYFQLLLPYLNGDVKEKHLGLEMEIVYGKQTLVGLKIII